MPRSALPILFTAALLAAACSADDSSGRSDDDSGVPGGAAGGADAATTVVSEPPSTVAAATDGGIVVIATVVAGNVLAREVIIRSPRPVGAQLTATSGDHSVSTPRTAATGTEHVLPLVGLRADRPYEVKATLFDGAGDEIDSVTLEVTTRPLPGFIPRLDIATADRDAMQPGLTLVELVPDDGEAGHVQIIDADGEVVWYRRDASSISAVEQTETGTFTGLLYPFAFLEFDVLGNQVNRWEFPGGDDPDAIVLDIDDGGWDGVDDRDYRNPHHDIAYLPNGNLLAMGMASHPTTADFRRQVCPDDDREWTATSDLVVEFEPDGTVVRTWDVWDVLDIEEHPGVHLCVDGGLFATPTERDWSHGNAAVYDPERDVVLVSLRHTDHVIAFEYGSAAEYPVGTTAPARWILGPDGTVPIDGEPSYHQHAPEVQDDGSIMIYDNGNDRPGDEPPYSRAVLYELDDSADPSEWRAVERWEHRVDDVDGTPLYAPFLGDADRLTNGNVLITHGGIGQPGEPGQRARIIEVVPSRASGGEIVYDVRVGTDELGFNSYRADRIDSLYRGELWRDE